MVINLILKIKEIMQIMEIIIIVNMDMKIIIIRRNIIIALNFKIKIKSMGMGCKVIWIKTIIIKSINKDQNQIYLL